MISSPSNYNPKVTEIDGLLTPIRLYEDIILVPLIKMLRHPKLTHIAGPIYPEEEYFSPLPHRYFFDYTPADIRPSLPSNYLDYDETCAYIGIIDNHYGHFIADLCVPKIWPIIASIDRSIEYLACARPFKEIPNWAREILFNYFQIKKLSLVTTPIKVKKLYVAPQIERLKTGFYDEEKKNLEHYLNFVDQMTNRYLENFDNPALRYEIVYVSRIKQLQTIIGEEYISNLFERAGIKVICPEEFSFKEQLYIYKNAHILIFAEGTAIHTLRFLGNLGNKKIIVINRRKNYRMDQSPLLDRKAEVHYLDYVDLSFGKYLPSLCDTERILEEIEDLIGISLLKYFDRKQYFVACEKHFSKSIEAIKTDNWPIQYKFKFIKNTLELLKQRYATTNSFVSKYFMAKFEEELSKLEPLIQIECVDDIQMVKSVMIEKANLNLLDESKISIHGIILLREAPFSVFVSDGKKTQEVIWTASPNIGELHPDCPNSKMARFIAKNLSFEYMKPIKFFLRTNDNLEIELMKIIPVKRFILNGVNIDYKSSNTISYINIDAITLNLLDLQKPNSLSIGGVVLVEESIKNKEDFQLLIEDIEGIKKVNWSIPSPYMATKYKNNPHAKNCRFIAQGITAKSKSPLKLYLSDISNNILLCEIVIDYEYY